MPSKIVVQLHLWPWSTGIREETINLTTGAATFPFFGSPVVSVSTQTSLFLPQRHERFIPFGPPFHTLGGEYRLHETPHGVMAHRRGSSAEAGGEISVHTENVREIVHLLPQGAKARLDQKRDEKEGDETELARVVLAWSQFFDDLVDHSKKTGDEDKLPWLELEKFILKIAEEVAEPRMALIVDIAKRMHSSLPVVVMTARKILLRENGVCSLLDAWPRPIQSA